MKKMLSWFYDKGVPIAIVIIFLAVPISAVIGPNPFDFSGPGLESGALIYVAHSGTFEIFLEDRRPPELDSHEFVFIHSESGERFYSRPPRNSHSYSNLTLGIHGRLVAIVDLDPGLYIIEFEQWDGRGSFLWGGR